MFRLLYENSDRPLDGMGLYPPVPEPVGWSQCGVYPEEKSERVCDGAVLLSLSCCHGVFTPAAPIVPSFPSGQRRR